MANPRRDSRQFIKNASRKAQPVRTPRFKTMHLTWIGAIMLPLGIYAYFFAPNLLYVATIFLLPFSATAILNFGFINATTGIQAMIYFGTLWMLSVGPGALTRCREWKSRPMQTSVRRLRFFMLVVGLSLLMPIWINGGLTVEPYEPGTVEAGPLRFTPRNITQTMYLAFGVLLTLFLAVKNSNLRELKKTIRIFLISSFFASCWGMLQWFCYWAGFNYPDFIFNTSRGESAMGYTQALEDVGLTRVCSVATEPSIFAQFSLIALVFAIFAVVSGRVVISKFWDRAVLFVTVVVLLMTTSTTAYVGLAIVVPVSLLGLWFLRRLKPGFLALVGLAILAVFVGYMHSSLAQVVADRMIASKVEAGSGLSRLTSVLLGFSYFLRYPVLGIGWGSATSLDLVMKLLSNTGILGLFAFGWFLKNLFAQLWRSMSRPTSRIGIPERTYWACCLLVASFILITTSELSGFAFVYGHTWFVFGIASAVPFLRESNPKTGIPTLASVTE